MDKIMYNIKPIAALLKDSLEECSHNPKRLIEIGVACVYGYALALEGFAPYYNELFTQSVGNILEGLEAINLAYISARDPSQYLPTQNEVEQLFEYSVTLAAQPLDIESSNFIHSFSSTVRFLKEKFESGSPSLDDVYSMQGLAFAFDQMDHCHSIKAYKRLVQHLEQYANAWPAKFALPEVRECLVQLRAA